MFEIAKGGVLISLSRVYYWGSPVKKAPRRSVKTMDYLRTNCLSQLAIDPLLGIIAGSKVEGKHGSNTVESWAAK